MKKLITIILIISLIPGVNIFSQELKCNIQVTTPQIQGTNKKIFQTLNTALYEFMNNRAWTNLTYGVNEKIECNILINIQQQISADEFTGTIQIQSRRPVYNSSYNTVMFNYKDDNFNFKYVEFQPLEFNDKMHQMNLTSVLAYYAYIIIGLDLDSFSPLGGTECFTTAEKIVSNAQNSTDKGWKPFEAKGNKNRYWLVKNILDKRYEPVRTFLYQFNRLGLDLMDSKPNDARAAMAEDLLLMQKVYREKPDAFMHFYKIIFDSKADELVNIFSESMSDEKSRVYQILNEIDNANAQKYKKIIGQ
jgi:hypothetical protein